MLRLFAYFFSILFHPLIIVTYMLIVLLVVNPYLFGVNSIVGLQRLVLIVFFSTFFIPAFAVFMMRKLDLISSLEMEDRQERTIPFIGTMVFYLWMYWNIHYNPDIPVVFKVAMLGATIGLALCFFINLFTKISAHAAGMGGLVGMMLITVAFYSYGSFLIDLGTIGAFEINTMNLLISFIIIAGLVGTSRLILDAHHIRDISGGFLVGIVTQFIALNMLT